MSYGVFYVHEGPVDPGFTSGLSTELDWGVPGSHSASPVERAENRQAFAGSKTVAAIGETMLSSEVKLTLE